MEKPNDQTYEKISEVCSKLSYAFTLATTIASWVVLYELPRRPELLLHNHLISEPYVPVIQIPNIKSRSGDKLRSYECETYLSPFDSTLEGMCIQSN